MSPSFPTARIKWTVLARRGASNLKTEGSYPASRNIVWEVTSGVSGEQPRVKLQGRSRSLSPGLWRRCSPWESSYRSTVPACSPSCSEPGTRPPSATCSQDAPRQPEQGQSWGVPGHRSRVHMCVQTCAHRHTCLPPPRWR